jgi:hypothetical protein
VKKHCNFCGEPLKDAAKECPQCGWDRSQDGPPSSDPADQKARAGVAAGLVVAYAVMWSLIQGTPDVARATPLPVQATASAQMIGEPVADAATASPVSVGLLPSPSDSGATPSAATVATPGKGVKALTIKIADAKAAHIDAHNALNYDFVLPETDQRCQLVGQLHGGSGFDNALETFLLTDDEYLFWHANQAAIPHSSWETIRGSETALSYDLPGAGTYHLVISNEMSAAPKTIQVKAQVRCVKQVPPSGYSGGIR